MTETKIKINVIDRKGNKTTIEAEVGETIRNTIANKLTPSNYGKFTRNKKGQRKQSESQKTHINQRFKRNH